MGDVKYCDIAFNFCDPQYNGEIRGKQRFDEDRSEVIQRCIDAGVDKCVLVNGSIRDIEASATYPLIYKTMDMVMTCGIHPTRANEWSNDVIKTIHYYLTNAERYRIRAIGECGLDKERLQFATLNAQIPVFKAQIELAIEYGLPLYMHNRKSTAELLDCLYEVTAANGVEVKSLKGVIHSWTDEMADLKRVLTETNFHIGLNGASLRDEDILNNVVPAIPLDRLQIETDAPWCSIKRTHPSYEYIDPMNMKESVNIKKKIPDKMLKDRNEPCTITQVADVIAKVGPESRADICKSAYDNSVNMFWIN